MATTPPTPMEAPATILQLKELYDRLVMEREIEKQQQAEKDRDISMERTQLRIALEESKAAALAVTAAAASVQAAATPVSTSAVAEEKFTWVRIFGEEYDVRARVEAIEGYSAHADQTELLSWASNFDSGRLQQLFLVHGEPDAATTLAGKLVKEQALNVTIPDLHQLYKF